MKKYVFDDYGNKYESMTKEEILASIEAGEYKAYVFNNTIIYNKETIAYEYNGTKVPDDLLVKLLDCAMDFDLNLASTDISHLFNLGEFKIHIFLCETEVYITNGHCDAIHIYNNKIGYRDLYSNGKQKNRKFVRTTSDIDNFVWTTRDNYDQMVIDPNAVYIVEDENYKVAYAEESNHSNYANRSGFADELEKSSLIAGNAITDIFETNGPHVETTVKTAVSLRKSFDITYENFGEELLVHMTNRKRIISGLSDKPYLIMLTVSTLRTSRLTTTIPVLLYNYRTTSNSVYTNKYHYDIIRDINDEEYIFKLYVSVEKDNTTGLNNVMVYAGNYTWNNEDEAYDANYGSSTLSVKILNAVAIPIIE